MPKYSVEYKKKVLAYFDLNGQAATVNKFGHHPSVIRSWKRKSETVGFMRKKSKAYAKAEKLDVLYYYWKNGLSDTEREFDLNRGTIHKWERIFREYGPEGLAWDGRGRKPSALGPKKDVNKDSDLLAENQRLRMENMYLKKLDALVREREERESKKKRK